MAQLCMSAPGVSFHFWMHTCRKHAHLQGRDKEIARLTESAFQDLLSKHINRAVDDRGQTHVEVTKHTVLITLCCTWILSKQMGHRKSPPLWAKLILADSAIAVQNACLLLASHKVLLSFIRNNEVRLQPSLRCFTFRVIGTRRGTAVHAAARCLRPSPMLPCEEGGLPCCVTGYSIASEGLISRYQLLNLNTNSLKKLVDHGSRKCWMR